MQKIKTSTWLAPIFCLLGFYCCGFSVSASSADNLTDLLKPVEPSTSVKNIKPEDTEDLADATIRTGTVNLSRELFANKSVNFSESPSDQSADVNNINWIGNQFKVTMFPDTTFKVQISSESTLSNGGTALHGRLDGITLATFSLTTTEEKYLITLDDPNSGLLYRVVGDSKTGLGQVLEIDRHRLPPSYDLPAIVPPQKSN